MRELTEDQKIRIMEQAGDMADREVVIHYAQIAGFDKEKMQDDDRYYAEAEDAIADLIYQEDEGGVLRYKEDVEDFFLEEYDKYEDTIKMLYQI
jgi:hypothetical protein